MRVIGFCLVVFFAVATPSFSAFPGRNGLIAYTRSAADGGRPDSVAVAALDGSEARVLVSRGSSPSWSPDGSKLLFQRVVGRDIDLYVVRADGTGVRRIRHPQRDDFLASWSPDGRRIVFTSDRHGPSSGISDAAEIYVVNADGRHLRRVTKNAVADDSPVWSPDGKRIAFSHALSTGAAIVVTTAAGKRAARLTTGFSDGAPSWSPDGSWIAFERYFFDTDDADVLAIHPDGSGLHLLVGGDTIDFMPAWSPDGSKLAFSRGQEASDVYIANADGSEPVPLVADEDDTFGPDWQPLP